MGKISFIMMSLICGILCSFIVSGAPTINSLALNHDTMECGGYWAGDEFSTYTLPEGWDSYTYEPELQTGECVEGIDKCNGRYQCQLNDIPESTCWGSRMLCEKMKCEGYIVNTDSGTCYIKDSAATCCVTLGYTFISDNIGERKFDLGKSWKWLAYNHPESFVLIVLIFIAYVILKRRYRLKA